MPHYHFHVRSNTDAPDTFGSHHPDFDAARVAAVKMAGQMLKDSADAFWEGDEWELTVADPRGLTLCSILIIGEVACAARPDAGSPIPSAS